MTLIDGDKIITAQLYDDEHEEYTEKKMSIIDFVNTFSDEGVTTADDVIDKIRAEIIEKFGESECAEECGCLYELLEIIDKYKAESEDKE